MRLALVFGMLVPVAKAAPAWAAEDMVPRIADCRIGFDGTFKVGHWTPVWVKVSGDTMAAKTSIELTTIDSDGVEVTVSTAAGSDGPTLLTTRVGRLGSAVQLKLVAEDGHLLDRAELSARRGQEGGARYVALLATGQLVVQIGPGALGLAEVLAEQEADDGTTASGFVQLTDVDALPTDWFGYDGVDVLVLTTSDVAFCERLAADIQRFDALRRWLELGGRLVICAGRTAPKLLGAGMPLADLVPGKFTELVRLPQTQALENFAGSGDAISQSGAQQNIPLPQLVEVQGRVELFGRGNDLPIVVRAARGLGELAFVGLDLSESPFAEWTGRQAFLRAVLRPYLADPDANRTKQKLVSLGYDDLAGALRQRLGRSFAGVAVIGFPWVAVLIIGYLLLLGPLDYLFVERATRRPWVAWLTLPVIVLATSLGAAMLAGAAKNTDGQRINRAELVDFDLTTGRTRGTCWATLYSPQAERFDVALAPRLPDGRPAENAQTLVSWLGLPGSGLGGMHAAGEPIDVTGVGYREATNLSELYGLPVLTASTKSLFARWDCPRTEGAAPPLAAELSIDDDGLLVGAFTNNTGAPLAGVCLLHGQWGYRLGDIQPGQRREIGPQLNAIRVKTIVTRRARRASASDQDAFLANRANADELLNVMMFYKAAGGEGFAGLPNRYQADCDLSRLLELDRAILVAGGKNRGSQWTDAGGESFGREQDKSTVIYRFIIPVDH
jgi:hypothetical protein